MRVVAWERIGDRRVRLLVTPEGAYAVTIEVLGPDHVWEDISLLAHARLRAGEAMRQYARRLEDQQISQALVQAE